MPITASDIDTLAGDLDDGVFAKTRNPRFGVDGRGRQWQRHGVSVCGRHGESRRRRSRQPSGD